MTRAGNTGRRPVPELGTVRASIGVGSESHDELAEVGPLQVYAYNYVSGMQGDPAEGNGYLKTMVTCKHFAGFNLGTTLTPDGGHSQAQTFNALITDQDMADTFLPAFRTCIVSGASVPNSPMSTHTVITYDF